MKKLKSKKETCEVVTLTGRDGVKILFKENYIMEIKD